MEAIFCHLKLAPLKQRRKSSRVRPAEFLGSPKSDFREIKTHALQIGEEVRFDPRREAEFRPV
jgi:hypothetical protein